MYESNLLFRPLKTGKNFVFGCILVFFLFFVVFRAKSVTTNNHRKVSNDISYKSPFSRDLNDIKSFEIFVAVSRKTSLKFLVFDLLSSK